jgi:hypothetical protein
VFTTSGTYQWSIVTQIYNKISGVYAITPNHALNIETVEKIIVQHNIKLLQYLTNYIEKIDNFALQEFNSKQQLVHFVEAKNYFNFKRYKKPDNTNRHYNKNHN